MFRAIPLLLTLFVLSSVQTEITGQPGQIVITHVTVIDATGAPAQPDMTVIITGDRITTIGKSKLVKIPPGAEVVDATGKFLIPGLLDMHIHLTIIPDRVVSREVIVPLLVAFGVTGVRDMGGDWQRIEQLRREIADGTITGPHIIAPGPFVDGPQQANNVTLPVSTEDEARLAVRKLKADGVDFIKVQATLSLPLWRAVIDEAKKLGIPVAGHIPERISAFDVARSTQRSVEHISPVIPGDAGVLLACSGKEAELRNELLEIGRLGQQPNADRRQLRERQGALMTQMVTTYDRKKCTGLLALLAKNQVWAVPTQVFGRKFSPLDSNDHPKDDALRFIPLSTRTRWDQRRTVVIKNSTAGDYAFRRSLFEKSRALVGEMHRAGVKLLAGTDAIDGYVVPGLSLHEELALMVEAGLTPMEALQTATRNPAVFFGRLNSQGTIAKGKIADLVLLDADPLADISNTQKIHAVILGGKLITQAKRQEMLSRVESFASKH
ncbi:MAG TPA: amidohydrolase family protein [Blastocatellia bacterium]|nr:amidohydrolase family protein [Blastocatellia bacterium]